MMDELPFRRFMIPRPIHSVLQMSEAEFKQHFEKVSTYKEYLEKLYEERKLYISMQRRKYL